jgi:hypothetical protein
LAGDEDEQGSEFDRVRAAVAAASAVAVAVETRYTKACVRAVEVVGVGTLGR